jgi:ATP/maltotriose-dependent transcriptional regulator MalT
LRIGTRQLVDGAVLAEILCADIADWPDEAWLVLDDYQLLSSSSGASEAFIDHLIAGSQLQVLVTSRLRPNWATARQILYGEIHEVSQSALAMTTEEARKLLPSGVPASGLLALADGWPAVIGLAAQSGWTPTDDDVELPATLYEYFAEELLRAADDGLQQDLFALAIAPRTTMEFLTDYLGAERASDVIVRGARLGFFEPDAADGVRIHPLLRRFLLAKLDRLPTESVQSTALAVGRTFVKTGRWDDAFEVVSEIGSSQLLHELLGAALDNLLGSGRLASLEKWTTYAIERGWRSAIIDLALANLALRRRSLPEAIALASRAARDPAVAPRALVLAGRAAHLSFDDLKALAFHERAELVAGTPGELREAVWGQFLSASDLGHDHAIEILGRLETVVGDDPDGQIQVATGHLALGVHRGKLARGLERARAAEPLVRHAVDPLARTSFLNSYSDGLVIASDYLGALDVVDRTLGEIERFRLDFAKPYALLVRAYAECGRRNTEAAISLSTSVRDHYGRLDPYLELNARMSQARALFVDGHKEAALVLMTPTKDVRATAALMGHYTACRALMLLTTGRQAQGVAEALRAKELTRGLEAHALAEWTLVISEMRGGEHPDLSVAARLSFEDGDLNSLVTAYRAAPALLALVYSVEEFRGPLLATLSRAADRDLARDAGFDLPSIQVRRDRLLSDRETEVAELLLRGMTNRQIAGSLFISEMTVKVHLRHIFAKVNARSRTQAALKLRDRVELAHRNAEA